MTSLVWGKISQFVSKSAATSIFAEVMTRFLLFMIFLVAEYAVAVVHVIQPEDLWKYRYPYKDSQVPFGNLLIFILMITIIVFYTFGRRKEFKGFSERGQATLGITYSIFYTMMLTNVIKSLVGRPRPNYLVRCYGSPDYLQITDASKPCINSNDWVGDLRKSFPSGHSSIAFSAFAYLSLYIAGKLGTFNVKGRGCMWRFVLALIPVCMATWVGITRFVDYHHHYDDVIVGSVLGTVIAYISYRQYYPSLGDEHSHYPSTWIYLGILTEGSHHCQPKLIRKMRPRQEGINDLGTYGYFRRDGEERVLSEPLIASAAQSVGTKGTQSLQSLTFNDSELSLSVHVNRRPQLPSSIMNNAELSDLSKASIAFYWDEEDLDENGTPLLTPENVEKMRQELLVALADLNRQSSTKQ